MSNNSPNSKRNLDLAIERMANDGDDPLRLRRTIANVVVGQFLPEGVVKGGCSLKLRFGNSATRFTRDLDTARVHDIEGYISNLENLMQIGWNGFTGHVVPRKPANPEGVPTAYVMQPFDIKLSYNGRSWLTVPLEVGHDEIGDAESPEYGISEDIINVFECLGFPAPAPIPLLPLPHQIAQKIHGATGEGSDRAHDLVDLQVIVNSGDIDYLETRLICKRLFAYRKQQSWPPNLFIDESWPSLYEAAREKLPVIETIDEAVTWTNNLIQKIDNARN
ncbi:MAG: nucleotidyl transferase AbiEii/AbiGii toxin family protein [Actinobacteria bacterium]|nr:nucleotidyl transferase AbiEii/AbiGii toxin family protein [Actinomycetota bacterium]